MKIDLHVHTDASDGTESVETVFARASELGLDVLAISDHDTTSNWGKAAEAAVANDMGFIPAIELTTRAILPAEDGSTIKFGVHLLAYLPNPNDEALGRSMRESVEGRVSRLQEITEKIAKDYALTWQDVLDQVQVGATLGRPAVADALIANGHFVERGEVFETIWFKGSPYYVPNRTVPETREAIELVRAAGGVPIIAHPLARSKNFGAEGDFPEAHFEAMIEAGLAGFEVEHREVEEGSRRWLREMARKHDLITTGSSDYHGQQGKLNEIGENTTTLPNLLRIIEEATGTSPVNLPF